MAGPGFIASVLVLSEDGGHRVVRALAKQMLRFIAQRNLPAAIDFEPEDEGAQEAMQGNLWKGTKTSGGHRRLVEIARVVATKIMSPTGYVLLHVDADRLWGERDRRPSENIQRFFKDIRLNVERHVADLLARQGRAAEKDAVLSRLCLLSPYYSIESWLLQNTVAAKNLSKKHRRGQHLDLFDRWERDRGLLDEVPEPKKATCLGSGMNHELATATYPARAVYQAGKSFTETIDRIKGCHDLVRALGGTADQDPG
ncbi:MAG: hypothetical protein U0359_01265 [Byssovorax sp.]